MTTTPNIGLYLPQSSDFVDVNRDVNNQLNLIDKYCYPLLTYQTNSLDWFTMPLGNNTGEKRFSLWDNSIRTWQKGSTGQPAGVSPWYVSESAGDNPEIPGDGWTAIDPAFCISPYVFVTGFPGYYRFTASYPGSTEGKFQFKGRMSNTSSFAVITSRTSTALMNLPISSSRPTSQQLYCGPGGLVDSDHYQYAKMSVDASNVLNAVRVPCGGNAATQTAANTGNYFILDGLTVDGVAF